MWFLQAVIQAKETSAHQGDYVPLISDTLKFDYEFPETNNVFLT